MPRRPVDVILVSDDAQLIDTVRRRRPRGARLKHILPVDFGRSPGAKPRQLWLDLDVTIAAPIRPAARCIYFHSRFEQRPAQLPPGLFIRKPCSASIIDLLWAGVPGADAGPGTGDCALSKDVGMPRAIGKARPEDRSDTAPPASPSYAQSAEQEDLAQPDSSPAGVDLPAWITAFHLLDPVEICRRCVAELPRRLGFEDVSMYLYSEEDGLLTLAETNHRRPIDLAVGPKREGGRFMLHAVRTRRLQATRDIWAEAAAIGEGLRIAPDARERYADGACLVAPLYGDRGLHGVLNFSRRRPRSIHVPPAQAEAVFGFLGRALEHARLHQRARTEARIDGLTGLANYRAFRETLEREVKRTARFGGALSLAALDLDGLKGVNDVHGHPAGDFILRNVAARITSVLRRFDQAARVGGDEFALILPSTDLPGARHVATRVVELLRRDPPRYDGRVISISASCGVAQLEASQAPDDLIREADHCLYAAKGRGKNRVVCCEVQGEPAGRPGPADAASGDNGLGESAAQASNGSAFVSGWID